MPSMSSLSTNSMTLAKSANTLVAFTTLTISRLLQVSRLSRPIVTASSRSHLRTFLLLLLPEIQSSTALASSRRFLNTATMTVTDTTSTIRKTSLSVLWSLWELTSEQLLDCLGKNYLTHFHDPAKSIHRVIIRWLNSEKCECHWDNLNIETMHLKFNARNLVAYLKDLVDHRNSSGKMFFIWSGKFSRHQRVH